MFENVKNFVIENAVVLGCTVAASVVSGTAGYFYGKRKGAAAAVATVAVAPATEDKKEKKENENNDGCDDSAK